jgi:hypothetical protein
LKPGYSDTASDIVLMVSLFLLLNLSLIPWFPDEEIVAVTPSLILNQNVTRSNAYYLFQFADQR